MALNGLLCSEQLRHPLTHPDFFRYRGLLMFSRGSSILPAILVLAALLGQSLQACTGITLTAKDGSIVFARTLEWGSFDLKSRLVIIPRGVQFKSHLEDGLVGMGWTAQYGAVGVDALEKDLLVDGMNEKGLSVNVFYHPGVAEYPPIEPSNLSNTIGSLDVCHFLLTTCQSVPEVQSSLDKIKVVGVFEPSIGMPAPVHLIVTDPSGKSIVVEFARGEMQIYETTLGVLTNAPTYDWHVTNLRNYLNLSPVSLPSKKIEEMNFAPLGGGSGMIGLPGDFTPPSRFVRAVAFSQTARPTDTGQEAMVEAFRILDNFNVPLGAAEGDGDLKTLGMRSSTLWTTAYDTSNRVMQYHTMHNRRVRQVDLSQIDFAAATDPIRLPLDREKVQDIQDVTDSVKVRFSRLEKP
jgi:choloylglycine hydrolase